MPAADVAPFHLGAYDATKGPFLNPATLTNGDTVAVTWPLATTTYDISD
jgi:sortase (surface protein transpeptidase)